MCKTFFFIQKVHKSRELNIITLTCSKTGLSTVQANVGVQNDTWNYCISKLFFLFFFPFVRSRRLVCYGLSNGMGFNGFIIIK